MRTTYNYSMCEWSMMLFFCKQIFCEAHLSLRALMSFRVEAKGAHASYALGTHQIRQDLIRMKCSIVIIWQNFSLAFIGVEVDQVTLNSKPFIGAFSFAESECLVLLRQRYSIPDNVLSDGPVFFRFRS